MLSISVNDLSGEKHDVNSTLIKTLEKYSVAEKHNIDFQSVYFITNHKSSMSSEKNCSHFKSLLSPLLLLAFFVCFITVLFSRLIPLLFLYNYAFIIKQITVS